MFRKTLVAVWCAIAAGCGSASVLSMQSPQAGPPPRVTPAPGTERRWASNRPLVWAEFLAEAPGAGLEGARTSYLLHYESRCRGRTFTFDVAAVFVPERSWVKPEVLGSPAESARVLRHERTHFDLTEVYARRMRKYFAELYDACGMADEQVDAAIARFTQEEAAAQQRYDADTNYGRMTERQRAWDRRVAEMLAELEAFAPADGVGTTGAP